MKQIFSKGLLFLGWCLLVSRLFAGSPAEHPPLSSGNALFPASERCDLDSVPNFRITQVGTYYISAAWDSVPFAQQYYLEALDPGSTKVISSLYTSGTSATLPVPTAGIYDVRIAAAAGGDCPPSANKVTIPNVMVLIVDLINIGYAPVCVEPAENSDCIELPMGTDKYFWFDIRQELSTISRYMVDFVGNGCDIAVARIAGEGTTPFAEMPNGTFGTSFIPVPPYPDQHAVINIWIRNAAGQDIFKISGTYGFQPNTIRLCIENLNSAYGLRLWQSCSYLPPPKKSDERDTGNLHDDADGSPQFTVQNPFSSAIRIINNRFHPDDPVATLRMFSADGNLVAQQINPASQEYILPTTDLPAGFYLLHIASGATHQTIKVVKAR